MATFVALRHPVTILDANFVRYYESELQAQLITTHQSMTDLIQTV